MPWYVVQTTLDRGGESYHVVGNDPLPTEAAAREHADAWAAPAARRSSNRGVGLPRRTIDVVEATDAAEAIRGLRDPGA